jgi:signal transduction histidine kinase
MPAGGNLTVRTELRQHEGRRYIGVSVTDTGIGMNPDEVSRIFEPFFTTKAEGRGTGLGLPISLGIVRKHGGTLEAESKPGQGTTMTLKLPL